jgi:hypothetical protein
MSRKSAPRHVYGQTYVQTTRRVRLAAEVSGESANERGRTAPAIGTGRNYRAGHFPHLVLRTEYEVRARGAPSAESFGQSPGQPLNPAPADPAWQ